MLRIDRAALVFTCLSLTFFSGSGQAMDANGRPANEPNWTFGVVRTGENRDAIKSLPMTARPYRPMHFYGNTVRRLHYRGTALPAPRDFVSAGAATVRRQ